MKIRININGIELEGELNGDNPDASDNIYSVLPLNSKIRTWGDEIYFPIPTDLFLVNTTTNVKVGDIAYWEGGTALCIFFGPTPKSTGDQPIPVSPVGILGGVRKPEKLKGVKEGQNIHVEAI